MKNLNILIAGLPDDFDLMAFREELMPLVAVNAKGMVVTATLNIGSGTTRPALGRVGTFQLSLNVMVKPGATA